MNAQELFKAGRLRDAIQALGAEVRDHPTDARRRTFLFELLCFAGEYERAGKHLNVLAQGSQDAAIGALLYRSALAAERVRQALFAEGKPPAGEDSSAAAGRPGRLNGRRFSTFEEADPRIGARLEVFVAGEYLLVPLHHVGALLMQPPAKLRDTMWSSARIVASPSFQGKELGEVLMPVLSPLSWKHPSDEVKLGRATEWEESPEAGAIPYGQKLFLVDGEEVVPFLEIRELIFDSDEQAQSGDTDQAEAPSDRAG